ncbi:hypothetical protein ACFSHQ_05750 [Gemmobacter lanyuensis]
MSGGQIVLVLGQTAETLSVYDASLPDKRSDVDLKDFASLHDGRILRAAPRCARLRPGISKTAVRPIGSGGIPQLPPPAV